MNWIIGLILYFIVAFIFAIGVGRFMSINTRREEETKRDF